MAVERATLLRRFGQLETTLPFLVTADREGAHADDDMSDNYRRVLKSEPLKFHDGTDELGRVNVTRSTVAAAGIELLGMLDKTFPKPVKGSGRQFLPLQSQDKC